MYCELWNIGVDIMLISFLRNLFLCRESTHTICIIVLYIHDYDIGLSTYVNIFVYACTVFSVWVCVRAYVCVYVYACVHGCIVCACMSTYTFLSV